MGIIQKYIVCVLSIGVLMSKVCMGYGIPNTDSLIAAHAHDFVSPLHIPLNVSGNFLEPRPGAYHMGVDFPAPMGTPVYAACDGYIWRLRITPYGYGRAVYIKHSNGLLTVYGHFSRFSDTLGRYLKEYQYVHKENEVDIYPPHDRLYVKKGDLIGYVGNAGQSTAPHLHFEIREAQGETFPLNPLLFNGFDTHDSKAPIIHNIVLYDGNRLMPRVITAQQGATIECNTDKVWLGVSAVDMDDAGYTFGVYGYALIVDGKEIFRREKKRLDFDYLHNTEAQIDYSLSKQGIKAYRLHTLPYDEEYSMDDAITMQSDERKTIQIDVYDVYHNKTSITFYLKGAAILNYVKDEKMPSKGGIWKGKNAIVMWAVNTSYVAPQPDIKDLTNNIIVDDKYDVAQKEFTVKYFGRVLSEDQKAKTVMHFGNSVSAVSWKGDTALAQGINYGYIYPAVDNVAPVVHLANSSGVVGNKIVWTMSDALSGIGTYDILIDNIWHVCYYDAKTQTVQCAIEDISVGQHKAYIIVKDKVGNMTSLNISFNKGVVKTPVNNKTRK